MGISKLSETGPTSLRSVEPAGDESVMRVRSVCSWPPWNFLMTHTTSRSFALYSTIWPGPTGRAAERAAAATPLAAGGMAPGPSSGVTVATLLGTGKRMTTLEP